MLFVPRKPKTTVFTMFIASGSKHHGIYRVFVPVPSKSTGIYAKIDFQKHLIILTYSFPAPDPEKRVNTSRVEDFGGSAEGARPSS